MGGHEIHVFEFDLVILSGILLLQRILPSDQSGRETRYSITIAVLMMLSLNSGRTRFQTSTEMGMVYWSLLMVRVTFPL